MPAEPAATAVVFVSIGALLTISVVASRPSARLGVPVAFVFLLIGMLAGSEAIGGIPFEDYSLTFRIGAGALSLILFDGGLNTPLRSMREVLAPAALLATIGVAITALITAAAAHLFGFSWPNSLLIGAIVSSTDAATVLSTLATGGIELRRRVALMLEVESGLNDPMAVILTTGLTLNILAPAHFSIWELEIGVVRQLAVGAAIGLALGAAARWLIARIELPAPGLYPAFTVGVAALAFGLPTLVEGSGFLAVYLAGATLGAAPLAERMGIRRVHAAFGWLSQVVMFLILGLLVFPSRLVHVAAPGLGVALVLAVVARPAAVFACLAPFRLPIREIAYVGWTGLRGAVPIILATIPVLGGVPQARELFDVVFFIVVVGSLVPGATVKLATRLMRVGDGRGS